MITQPWKLNPSKIPRYTVYYFFFTLTIIRCTLYLSCDQVISPFVRCSSIMSIGRGFTTTGYLVRNPRLVALRALMFTPVPLSSILTWGWYLLWYLLSFGRSFRGVSDTCRCNFCSSNGPLFGVVMCGGSDFSFLWLVASSRLSKLCITLSWEANPTSGGINWIMSPHTAILVDHDWSSWFVSEAR